MRSRLLNFNKYNELIEIIYQSATEPEAFEWLLDFIIENTYLHSGSITIQDTENFQVSKRISVGVVKDKQFKSDYLSLDENDDCWSLGLIKNKMPSIFFPDHKIVDRSIYIKSKLKPLLQQYDIAAGTGAHWLLPNNKTVRFIFHKNQAAELFNQDELTFLNSLSRHISRAISINQKLQASQHKASLVDHIERNNQCVALISLKGKVISSSSVFEQFIENRGLLQLSDNHVFFKMLDTQKMFENCLLQVKYLFAQSNAKQSFVIASNDNDADFQCVLTPLINKDYQFDLSESVKVVLTIEPLAVRISDKSPQIIAQTNVTPTELEICIQLARGLSIKEISQNKCRSENTVRTQVKSIQRKFSVNSQAGIVSKILTF